MSKINLELSKPLVILKINATGANTSKDRIISLSVMKFSPDSKEPISNSRLINPTIPIPADSSDYYGISDADVENEKTFANIASKLVKFIGDSDIAGFDVEFDVSMLVEEFNRTNINFALKDRRIIDLSSIYRQMMPRDIYAAIHEFTGKAVSPSRRLGVEEHNRASVAVLNGMAARLTKNGFVDSSDQKHEVENSIDSICQTFSGSSHRVDFKGLVVLNRDHRMMFGMGKYKNKLISEVFSSKEGETYYRWIIDKSDFTQETKDVIVKAYNATIDKKEEGK